MKILQTKPSGLIILLFFIIPLSKGQESCTEKLGNAHAAFEKGQIDKVPDILGNCLSSGFTRDEKVSAYRLLTLCDLYYNRSEEAAVNMQKMLKINPEYKIQDIDPSEFQKLYGKFRTVPVFIIGLKGGIGLTNFYNVQNYNDINSHSGNGIYMVNPCYNGGISIESPLTHRFSVVLETYISSYNYTFERNLIDYANIILDENIMGIEAPLMAQFNLQKNKKVIPYVNAGFSFYYMLNSSVNVAREDTLGNFSREPASEKLSLIGSRNNFNLGVSGNIGVRIKDIIGKGYLTFDMRYSRYFFDVVDNANRADNVEITYGLLHTDNSFKVQNIQFFIGYKLPLYIPRLKRSVRKEYIKANMEN